MDATLPVLAASGVAAYVITRLLQRWAALRELRANCDHRWHVIESYDYLMPNKGCDKCGKQLPDHELANRRSAERTK